MNSRFKCLIPACFHRFVNNVEILCTLKLNWTIKLISYHILIQGLVWLIVSGVLNKYDYRWMVMLDFICMGSFELFETGRERKIENDNRYLQRDLNPSHITPGQVNQRFRQLGHAGQISSGVFISLTVSWVMNTNGHVTIHVWDRLCFDSQCKIL